MSTGRERRYVLGTLGLWSVVSLVLAIAMGDEFFAGSAAGFAVACAVVLNGAPHAHD